MKSAICLSGALRLTKEELNSFIMGRYLSEKRMIVVFNNQRKFAMRKEESSRLKDLLISSAPG